MNPGSSWRPRCWSAVQDRACDLAFWTPPHKRSRAEVVDDASPRGGPTHLRGSASYSTATVSSIDLQESVNEASTMNESIQDSTLGAVEVEAAAAISTTSVPGAMFTVLVVRLEAIAAACIACACRYRG
jgi:hypothetical protein